MNSEVIARTVEIYGIVQDQKYVYSASTAVLVYDILLTMGREVQLFWTGRFSGATLLYFSIRCTGVLVNILGFAPFVPNLNQEVIPAPDYQLIHRVAHGSCNAVTKVWVAMEDLEYLPSAVFSGMRGYALTRRWTWGVVIFVLSLFPVAVNLADLALYSFGAEWPVIGCYKATQPMRMQVYTSFIVLSRAPLIIADLLLVVITLHTLRRGSRAGVSLNHIRVRKRRSLSDIMLWNGVLYFTALSILNILQVILNAGGTTTNGVASWVAAFIPPLNTILISRFLLDLQEAKSQDMRLEDDATSLSTTQATPVGTLNFAGVIGSMGSTIDSPREASKDKIEVDVDSPAASEFSSVKFFEDLEEQTRVVVVAKGNGALHY